MKKIIAWIKNYRRVLVYGVILLSLALLVIYLFSLKFPTVIIRIIGALEIFTAIIICILEQKNSRLNGDDKEKERIGCLVCTVIFASFISFMGGECSSREIKGQLIEMESKLEADRKAELIYRGQNGDSFLSEIATSKNMGCVPPPIKGANKHFFCGYALYKAGGFYEDVNYKYAIEEFNLAKDESKELENSSELWMAIGFCHNQLGEQEKAIEALKQSLRLSKCAANYCTLAKIYADTGRFEEAKELLDRAIRKEHLKWDEMIIYCYVQVDRKKTFSQETFVKDMAEQKYNLRYPK